MAGTALLTGKVREQTEQLLVNVVDALDDHGIDYWLHGGTLLGAVREGRLLPWDTDCDLCVRLPNKEAERNLLAALSSIRVRTRKRYIHESHGPMNIGDLRMLKVRNYRFGILKGKCLIDIFVVYEDQTFAYWALEKRLKRIERTLLEEMDTVSMLGRRFRIPKQFDEVLTVRYGDWRTPNKHWDPVEDDGAVFFD